MTPASRLLSTGALLMAARLAGAGAGFGAQILLARAMPSEQLGLFFLATSVAAVLGAVASGGFPGVATRFFASYQSRKKPDLLAAFMRQSMADTWRLAWLTALAVATFAALAPLHPDLRIGLALSAVSIPAIAATRLNGAFANAVRHFELSYLPDLFWRPVLFGLAVAAWTAFGPTMSGLAATALMSGVIVLLSRSQAGRLARKLPVQRLVARPTPRVAALWRRAARPLVVVTLFTALFADLDLVVVGVFLSPADLAVFGVCLKLAFLVGFAVQMVTQLVSRDLADGFGRGDRDLVARAVARANGPLVLATFGALAGAVAFGDALLGVFGPDFAAGHATLVVLVASQCVRALAGPSIPLLTLAVGQARSMVAATLSLAVLIVSTALLAPALGGLGAALAVAITMAVWAVFLGVVLHRRTGLRTDAFASLVDWRRVRRAPAPRAGDLPVAAMMVREPQVLR